MYQDKGIIPEISAANHDGIDAIRIYRQENPDAVIAAGEIEENNVEQALSAIKAGANILMAMENPFSPQLVKAVRAAYPQVVMIAAAQDLQSAQRSIEAGVDGIKIRPFALDPSRIEENLTLLKTLRKNYPHLIIGGSRGITPGLLPHFFDQGMQFVGLGVNTALEGVSQLAQAHPNPVLDRAMIIRGPEDMTNESRVFFSPWSRLARGTGLGQYTQDFNPKIAQQLRHVYDLLDKQVPAGHAYNTFSKLLTEFILNVENPANSLTENEIKVRFDAVIAAMDKISNPYQFATVSAILMDVAAKLKLNVNLLVNAERDLVQETLDKITTIPKKMDGIYGYYEQVTAYTSVFVSMGQLGLKAHLADGQYIRKALGQLETIPSPWNRGRGASMLFATLKLLGFEQFIFEGGRDYIKETLSYVDQAEELNIWPTFPSVPLTHAYFTIEPYITLLNAISMLGKEYYDRYNLGFRVAKVNDMMKQLSPEETMLIGEYYLLTLYNLGVLDENLQKVFGMKLDEYLKDFMRKLQGMPAAPSYFPNGVAYPYAMETAWFFGRNDLITDEMVKNMLDSLPAFTNEKDVNNWGHPLSYILNIMGQLGRMDEVFSPRDAYHGQSVMDWGIEHFAGDKVGLEKSIPLFNHSIISLALRMRGAHRTNEGVYQYVSFAGYQKQRAVIGANDEDMKSSISRGNAAMNTALTNSPEARLLFSPWMRLARGIGIGHFPINYDPKMAQNIRHAYQMISQDPRRTASDRFSMLLTDFILDINNPEIQVRGNEKKRMDEIVETLQQEKDPYAFATAASVLIDTVAKLGLPVGLVFNDRYNLINMSLDRIGTISELGAQKPGAYEKVSAYTSLFFSVAHLQAGDYLIRHETDHIQKALDLLAHIPAAWNRGRAGATLFAALKVLGKEEYLFKGRNYVKEIFDFIDEGQESHDGMTPAFFKVFPLLTLLNTISSLNHPELVHYKKDRVLEAQELMEQLTPTEKVLMTQYYLMALSNLGVLNKTIGNLNVYLEKYAHLVSQVSTSGAWFPHGIVPAYAIETFWFFGRPDLITHEVITKALAGLQKSFSDSSYSVNRDNPLSYTLNALNELGEAEVLFTVSQDWGNQEPFSVLMSQLMANEKMRAQGLPSLHNALINISLRMRGTTKPQAPVYQGIQLTFYHQALKELFNDYPLQTDIEKEVMHKDFVRVMGQMLASPLFNEEMVQVLKSAWENLKHTGHQERVGYVKALLASVPMLTKEILERDSSLSITDERFIDWRQSLTSLWTSFADSEGFDRAQVTGHFNKPAQQGGIDLTAANLHLETRNSGVGITFHPDPAMIKALKEAPGFVPVIIHIQPMSDLRTFLNTPAKSVSV